MEIQGCSRWWTVLAFVPAILAAGCSKENNVAITNNNTTTVVNNTTVVVGESGGRVESSSHASAEIPEGALAEDTEITVGEAVEGTFPALAADQIARSKVYAFTPHGLSFAKPVTITLPHTAGPGSDVRVLTASPEGQWSEAAVVEVGPDSVKTSTTHFSFFVSTTPVSSHGTSKFPTETFAQRCDASKSPQSSEVPFKTTKIVELPIGFDWDTGWIPEGYDELQTRAHVQVPLKTTVGLSGTLKATWPDGTLSLTPDPGGTTVDVDLGLSLETSAKIDLTVQGTATNWQGPVPYPQNVDFHVLAAGKWDSFGFDTPALLASAKTEEVQLFAINMLQLAEMPVEVSQGGLSFTVSGEMNAIFQMNSIALGTQMLTSKDGTVPFSPPTAELTITPKGQVHYDGVIHLFPKMNVVASDEPFAMPTLDYPVTIPLGDQEFLFDATNVTIPLPKLVVTKSDQANFGAVQVGGDRPGEIEVTNQGAQAACVVAVTEGPDAASFVIEQDSFQLASGQASAVKLRFKPTRKGPHAAVLTLGSNDPVSPLLAVELNAQGE